MQTTEEHVILVDENNNILGTVPKATVHTDDTPLHRAFSFFLFNSQGQLLLQQRALHKVTWPGVWSNSCCGHPAMGETYEETVKRRVKYEIGYDIEPIEILPNYRYQASRDGVMENEICPVWIGFSDDQPQPNPDEVNDTKWVDWKDFIASIKDPEDSSWDHLSIWCKEEATLIDADPKFQELIAQKFQTA